MIDLFTFRKFNGVYNAIARRLLRTYNIGQFNKMGISLGSYFAIIMEVNYEFSVSQ